MIANNPSEFSLQPQGVMDVDSLAAILSGNRAVNLAMEIITTDHSEDDSVHPHNYQGIVQVTHKNNHPGITAWSSIKPQENDQNR